MPRPLTDLQKDALVAFLDADHALTGNELGHALGFQPGDVKCSVPKHRTGGGCIRSMGPAQRVIPVLNGLRKRGLITFGHRKDGRSGSAYRLSGEGRVKALVLKFEREMDAMLLAPLVMSDQQIVDVVTPVAEKIAPVRDVSISLDRQSVVVMFAPEVGPFEFTAKVV